MPKIAIIEDDKAISEMYRIKFQSEGFDVQIADDGETGLALIEEMRPDIVLLDIMMPKMTGDIMLERLRATEFGKGVKVIILTNMGEQEAPDRLKELSVSSFIVKAEMTPRQVAELVKDTLSA